MTRYGLPSAACRGAGGGRPAARFGGYAVIAVGALLVWSPGAEAQTTVIRPGTSEYPGGPDQSKIPSPVRSNSPAPLAPLGAKPGTPDPSSPQPVPPATIKPTPSAQQESVKARPRPEFQPQGMELDRLMSSVGMMDRSALDRRDSPLASFIVSPRLEIDVVHDSNVFRTENATSDRIVVTKPSLQIRSDWAANALSFEVKSAIGRYQKNDAEDYEDVSGRVNGSVELFDDTKLSATFGLAREHSQRGAILDPSGPEGPTIIHRSTVRLGVEQKYEPLTMRLTYSAEGYDYESTAAVDNEDLDNVEEKLVFRSTVEVDEGTSLFVQPSYNWKTFDRTVDSAGIRQDNEGVEILTGVTWDASSITFLELGAGYFRQTFDDPALATIQGPTVSARAIWNPGPLWTVTLNSSRQIQETASPGESGVLVTALDLTIDYEFLYNTIVSLTGAVSDEDYRSSTRSDTRTRYGLRIEHLFNEYLYGQVQTTYRERSSSVVGSDFKAFTALLRLGARI